MVDEEKLYAIRLECLKLSLQSRLDGNPVLTRAEEWFKWVTDGRRTTGPAKRKGSARSP